MKIKEPYKFLTKDNFLNMQEIGRTFLKEGSICIDEYKRILILE
jgi:hypothetical protein